MNKIRCIITFIYKSHYSVIHGVFKKKLIFNLLRFSLVIRKFITYFKFDIFLLKYVSNVICIIFYFNYINSFSIFKQYIFYFIYNAYFIVAVFMIFNN